MEPSSSDKDVFSYFGTEFAELENEKDGISKKPLNIQDQIVTDEKGRRRFHGAFTGGFSAGYFMSVGTKEGWAPKAFKSSRGERAEGSEQTAEDYMDAEDLGEYGIAPRKIKTTKDFHEGATRGEKKEDGGLKRGLAWERSGATAELLRVDDLVKPVQNSFGIKLLQKMGWRQGKGIGRRVRKKKTEKEPDENQRVIGCQLPPGVSMPDGESSSEDSEEEAVMVLPEDLAPTTFEPKTDVHGLGYKGLASGESVLNQRYAQRAAGVHSGRGRGRGRGIRGQAFGVGAFEEEDADIYTHEDISQYDYSLGGVGSSSYDQKIEKPDDGFVEAKDSQSSRKFFSAPKLPRDFTPGHKPLPFEASNDFRSALDSMKEKINPVIRAKMLGEEDYSVKTLLSEKDRLRLDQAKKNSSKAKPVPEKPKIEDKGPAGDPMVARAAYPDDAEKRERFTDYLKCIRKGFTMSQPPRMTEWEWEKEKKEFAAHLPPALQERLQRLEESQRPLAKAEIAAPFAHLLKSKFTSAKHDLDDVKTEGEDEDKVQAVKMKMFGRLTREKHEWHPGRLLCKHFNLPDPYPGYSIVGVPSMMKPKTNRNAMIIGDQMMPSTAQELTNRASGNFKDQWKPKAEPVDDEESSAEQEPGEEIEDPQSQEERPPIDLFKAIFGQSESEERSDSDDDIAEGADAKSAGPLLGQSAPSMPKDGLSTSANKDPNPALVPKVEPLDPEPDIQILPQTVPPRDEVPDPSLYGPALPPPPSDSAALPYGFSSSRRRRSPSPSSDDSESEESSSSTERRRKKKKKHSKSKKKKHSKSSKKKKSHHR